MPLGEFELIAKYFSRGAQGRPDVVLGVGDDAALLRVPEGRELVVAADTVVSGVHFPSGIPPAAIGHRALAVNLSDLAAMGATPAWFTLALTLPRVDEEWLAEFSRGLFELAGRFGMALVGGDTTSGPLAITVQAMGHATPGTSILRSGARSGDDIYLSATTGDAAAGLAVLQGELDIASETARADLIDRFLWPEPRVELGAALVGVASAGIDVSDGLLADLGKLLAASDCGGRLDLDLPPVSPALMQVADPRAALGFAAAGGDDYELCFTAPPGNAAAVERIAAALAIPLTRIGVVESAKGLRCFRDGREVQVQAGGFDHFK